MSTPAVAPAPTLPFQASQLPHLAAGEVLLNLRGRVVLLATDGSEGAAAAGRFARALDQSHHADVRVVNVVDTRGAPLPPPLDIAIGLADGAVGDAVHAEQEAEVRRALSLAFGSDVKWPVHVTLGTPAHAIAREARRANAALIVVGLRRHNVVDRALGDETTLNLIRHAPCPVVAVTPGTTGLPANILAALDFSTSSILAARAAAAIAAHGAKVTLAYVPTITMTEPDDGEAFIHQLGVATGFSVVGADLPRDGMTLEHVILEHEKASAPAAMLLDYADTARCDLIAAGSARRGRGEAWLLGSVSTELVRDGRHALLVVPRPETAR